MNHTDVAQAPVVADWTPFAQQIERLGMERYGNKRGWQMRVAEAAGVSPSTLNRILNAGRDTDARSITAPPFQSAVVVGGVFGITPNQIAEMVGLREVATSRGLESDPSVRSLIAGLGQIQPETRRHQLTQFLVRAVAAELEAAQDAER